jgi:hypothetical protein
MENSLSAPAQSLERCDACFTDVATDDVYCPNCGYPVKGTEQEQKDFRLNHDFQNIDLFHFNDKVRKAGNVLYYLSGIFVVSGMIFYFLKKDSPDAIATLITNLILAMLFLALGGYSRKKPLACIISGLCLYAIILVLDAIVDPVSIVRGIFLKIVIVGLLVKGLKSAIEIEKIRKENNLS